jgi:LPS-assembly protein
VTKASATTCDGPSPAWTIQAEHLTITEGGYAAGPGMVFKGVGSTTPLLALPYFIFPVKTERQSGILAPTVGTSSQNGPMASLPFFWATGENHDLTITPVWREKRGLSSNLEGRYHVDWGRGLWQFSHLKDQADRYYKFEHPRRDEKSRHARERSWLRAQNQGRAGAWDVNLNLDLVSDPLYLKEFPNDPDGFNQSSRAFSSTFGHTLNEALDPNRANALYAQKLDGSTQTRAGIYYTQNLNNEANRDTTQRLPTLQYDLVGHEVLDSGFQSPRLSLNTRYDNFYRLTDEKSETTETGHRLRFQPTVDWAESLGLAGLKVAGGLDMAAYAADGRRPPSTMETGHDEHWYNLMSGSAEAELSTTFSRVFEGGPGRATATRHQISPTLALSYVSAPEDQGRLPYWDHLDRRLPRQTWRYGLSNSLVAKTPGQSPGAEEPQAAPADNYFQFLKFGIWTSYEMADNRHLTNNIADRYYDTNYYGRGPGPLETHMEAFFNPHISMRMISSFNTRTGQPISHDLNLNMADGRGDRLNLIYDYNAPKAKGLQGNPHQQARGILDLRLNSEWSGSFSTRYDLNGNRALESTTRLAYQAQCYGLSLFFTKTYREQSVGLMVDLLGLGTIDSSTAFANSDNI